MTPSRHMKLLAASAALTAVIAGASGCTGLKVSNLTPTKEASGGFKELSQTDRAKMSKDVLVGEVQTVAGSDIELARIFGQVANLSSTPYAAAKFEVIAEKSNSEGTVSESKRVASFTLNDLKANSMQPFEVQTTYRAGDMKGLKVVVVAVK